MSAAGGYDAWHARRAEADAAGLEPDEPWHRTTLRMLPPLDGLDVLEAGCGRGQLAVWLASRCPDARIVGVDASRVAIEKARERARRAGCDLALEVGDVQALAFPDDSFDVVVSCETLEHVEHPERMARELARVLRPGGRFVLTTENYANGMLVAWIRTWLTGAPFDSGSGVQARENFFVFWTVRRLLARGGLEIRHEESNHFQWLLLPRTDPARLRTDDVRNSSLRRLLRPFGRHYTFCGVRPTSASARASSSRVAPCA